jgi:hypothetical protein
VNERLIYTNDGELHTPCGVQNVLTPGYGGTLKLRGKNPEPRRAGAMAGPRDANRGRVCRGRAVDLGRSQASALRLGPVV